MGNLIVADNEYFAIKEKYTEIGELAESQLDQYFKILEKICENAISDGVVFSNLITFVNEAKKLKGQVSNLTKNAGEAFDSYITEIDAKDEYIYES